MASAIIHIAVASEINKTLKLNESSNGIYTNGTYYDFLKGVIEQSLTNYLNDNYTSTSVMQKYIDSLKKGW